MLQTVQEDTVGESDNVRERSPFFSPKKQKTEAGHKVSVEAMLALHCISLMCIGHGGGAVHALSFLCAGTLVAEGLMHCCPCIVMPGET